MSPQAEALSRLSGARRVGGELSRLRFSRALGLEGAPAAFTVQAVGWIEDHVEVLVGTGTGGAALLKITGRSDGPRGLAVTEHLVLRRERQPMPHTLARRVASAFTHRMAGATLARIAASLEEDPELREGPLMPVVAETAPDDDAVDESRGDIERRLAGMRLAGGDEGRRRFTELLGLEDAPAPYRVASLAWISDHIEIGVGTEDGREIRFTIFRRTREARGFILSPKLVLSYQAKDIPDALSDRVGRRAKQRLGSRSLDDLAAMLEEDPDFGKVGLPMPSKEHEHPTNQLDTWGGEDAYADFFAGGEIARSQLDSVDISKFSRNVQHCDAECLFVNPHSEAEVATLVEYPWEDRVRNIGTPLRERLERLEHEEHDDEPDAMISTNLDENDVIMGNPDKLRDALDRVTRLPNPSQKPLLVANTCVPTVTGEDVASVVDEYRKKVSYPILYLTVTPQSMNDVLVDLLVTRRKRAEDAAPPPDPNAINLVGYAEGRALRELADLLARFDVTVNCALLPALEVDILDRMPNGALNVFCPNSLWAHLYEQVRKDSRVPGIVPPAPYGIAGTWTWLEAVLTGLSRDVDPHRATWQTYLDEHDRALATARERATGQRLGVIVRGEEVHYLLDSAETWGIPLAGLTQELGFGLDVFVGARNQRSADRLARQVEPLIDPSRESLLHAFDSFDAMRRLLGDSACRAVLTNHSYDWRTSEAGKSRFSLQHFELGVPGALRTSARLSELCETPFFERYRRYLGRTMEGLRAPLEASGA